MTATGVSSPPCWAPASGFLSSVWIKRIWKNGSSHALAARREGRVAPTAQSGWLQEPGLYISRITRDTLHQLRSGLWSYASYNELTAEPSKSNFTVFSLLPTRSPSASNLLPADGLKYTEFINVLRNLFFLLFLPVTQNLYNSTPKKIEAVVDSTVLLLALHRFLDWLCDDPRSFNTVSVRSYWESRCDARARNALAFIILSSVDKFLSFMSMCVTHTTPTFRLALDNNDNNNVYLVVDPRITNPVLQQSRQVKSAPNPYIHSALSIWDSVVSTRFDELLRGEPATIPAAPEC